MSMGLYVVNVYGRMNEWALTHSGHFIGKRHTLVHMWWKHSCTIVLGQFLDSEGDFKCHLLLLSV